MSSVLSSARRAGRYTALAVYRRLPAPVRRTVVRAVTPGFTVGAVCLIDHDGAVLFLRQPHRKGWSLPGGLLEEGERAADGVVREVREETGLRVAVGVPLSVHVNARVRRVDVLYRVVVDHRPAVRPAGEAVGADWLRPAEVGDDIDAPTREILALFDRARRAGAAEGRVVTGA